MTINVSAVQAEALGASPSKGAVSAVTAEIVQTTPDRAVNAHAAQLEYTFVQPDKQVNVHASQFESLQVENPGVVNAHASQIEVLLPLPEAQTPVQVATVTIEVLRGIPDKKRRPPLNVVAN